jgi:pseudouridine-5'-phosphate glycosidase
MHYAHDKALPLAIGDEVVCADAIDRAEVDGVIAAAIAAARRDGVRGNALTRYLMRAVERHTAGRATRANMSVLISTAELAGRLAVAHARVRARGAGQEVRS